MTKLKLTKFFKILVVVTFIVYVYLYILIYVYIYIYVYECLYISEMSDNYARDERN